MACWTNVATKPFVAMAIKRHPSPPMKMLKLAMNSKCLKFIVHSCILLGFHSKNRVPLAKNSPVTATITFKPECSAHSCVEQDLLYPWMCYTTWFEFTEAKTRVYSASSSLWFHLRSQQLGLGLLGVCLNVKVDYSIIYQDSHMRYKRGGGLDRNHTCWFLWDMKKFGTL